MVTCKVVGRASGKCKGARLRSGCLSEWVPCLLPCVYDRAPGTRAGKTRPIVAVTQSRVSAAAVAAPVRGEDSRSSIHPSIHSSELGLRILPARAVCGSSPNKRTQPGRAEHTRGEGFSFTPWLRIHPVSLQRPIGGRRPDFPSLLLYPGPFSRSKL